MNNWYNKYSHYISSGFVLVFMFLLLVCALLFIFEQDILAERLSNWAYPFLGIGVGIRLVQLLKERKD